MYQKTQLKNNKWVITSAGLDFRHPRKCYTFAIDTETQVLFDGKILPPLKLFDKIKKLNTDEKRKRIQNITWAWQCYDEFNGFFMTNDFYVWLLYQCNCRYKFGWCYNSTFDFAQIDAEILGSMRKHNWTLHEHVERGKGEAYNKGQPWTYESIHNDMGARYAYKLWIPYKNADRHIYTHAVEYRDFMKLITGGLEKLLKDLNVTDNDGMPIRKLKMNYQNVITSLEGITDDEIAYCENDVKGLYFAIKMFNATVEEQTNHELHIFGKETNVMTAGGFAKSEMLRTLYPQKKTKRGRLKQFKKEHPITAEQDKYFRDNHLYRGGIAFVNPYLQGKMITNRKMYRYDVNSEYPYAMSIMRDLIGKPFKVTVTEYDKMKNKDDYEAIYILKSVYGDVKKGYLGLWYDPFKKEYVEHIHEYGEHLIFERELNEMSLWYENFEFSCDYVILVKRAGYAYRQFVETNYALKNQAKKDGNKTLQQVSKLLLNSSYGKLAERIMRVKGHYELNEDTGAIHFVRECEEIDDASSMNVIIGALVTCIARCYILGKAREIHGNKMRDAWQYIDTDSLHTFLEYKGADAFTLGGLKLEAICDAVKYLAPKTYIDIEKVAKDGTVDYDAFEIHCKGLNVMAVIQDLKKKQKYKKHGKPTLKLLDTKIDYGQKYKCLVAMNVQGGKVLLLTEKYIAREELKPQNLNLAYTNYEGGMFIEI